MDVIGTAGHVDHGKSRLVLALTGMDPDRLAEEKARGLTIDLGFAWGTLPSGREVSIVDVPGHERFIKNMLAGVGGIDVALLVIAADEGVMPQTREHLAILDLLNVRHGVVALTKTDLVEDAGWLDLVEAEIGELLAETSLAGAPVVRCSAVTGAGLTALRSALDAALDALPPVRDSGRPRLPIDRAFSISGFGTVVTGTLIEGRLRVGDQVEILPAGLKARVRGLQSHKQGEEEALPGTRTAVNLGGVSVGELERGMVLTVPGWLRPTSTVDVRLRAVASLGRPLRHNLPVTFHTGAAETPARVRLLEGEMLAPGASAWAQVRLDTPVAVARGDGFVIRSTEDTIGGGQVVDPHPPRRRRNDQATLAALERLLTGTPADAVLTVLQRMEPARADAIARAAEIDARTVQAALARLQAQGAIIVLGGGPAVVLLGGAPAAGGALLMTTPGYAMLADRAVHVVTRYTETHPLRSGIPREEARSQLRLEAAAYAALERSLEGAGRTRTRGAHLDLAERPVTLSPSQEAAREAIMRSLREGGVRPAALPDADPELLSYLEQQGAIVRAPDGLAFATEAYAAMEAAVIAALRERERITLAEVRDLLDTGRRHAQALLESMDQRGLTRRVGETRLLRSS